MATVEIKEWSVPKETAYGTVQQRVGLDRVYVNGRLGGYVPVAPDPNADVFHPLSGFPQELVPEVVASNARFKRSLAAPVPHAEPEEDVDDDA